MFHPDAEGADLRFLSSLANPYPDPSLGPMRINSKLFQRIDHPALERMDEATDVLSALFKVENHVPDPLAGTMIGVTTAPASVVDR